MVVAFLGLLPLDFFAIFILSSLIDPVSDDLNTLGYVVTERLQVKDFQEKRRESDLWTFEPYRLWTLVLDRLGWLLFIGFMLVLDF